MLCGTAYQPARQIFCRKPFSQFPAFLFRHFLCYFHFMLREKLHTLYTVYGCLPYMAVNGCIRLYTLYGCIPLCSKTIYWEVNPRRAQECRWKPDTFSKWRWACREPFTNNLGALERSGGCVGVFWWPVCTVWNPALALFSMRLYQSAALKHLCAMSKSCCYESRVLPWHDSYAH